MSRPRAVLLGGALLVLLLALTPLIPRGERDGALRPSGRSDTGDWTLSGSPGGGRLTEQLVSEIDRVVAEGLAVGRLDARSPGKQAAATSSPTWPAAPTSRARPTAWASAGPPRARRRSEHA